MNMKKTTIEGNTKYIIEVDNGIRAIEKVYCLSGYSNNYETEWVLDITKYRKYAKYEVLCGNYGWACRGHGMTEVWKEAEGTILKDDVIELIKKIEDMDIENGTKDVKEAVEMVKDFIVEQTGIEVNE